MSKQIEKIKELIAKREQARLGGGEKAIEKQHARGKYTARERIEMLVDAGSFEEYDMFKLHRCTNFGMEKKQYLGDGVVAGSATIAGRLVYVYAQDFTVNGGSLSETMAQKICKVMDMAMTMGAPVICMNDSGGARIQEGICALAGYGEIFERNILASGVIPQISAIMGPCAGGAVYSPALTDFIIMKEQTSYMFLTGPKVVKTVTGEDIDAEHLGGASVHATKSGVTHFAAKTEEEAIEMIKSLLSYIPSNNTEEAPRVECTDPIDRMDDTLNEIIPEDPNQAYDMYKVIGAVTDNGEFFEVQPKFAKNIITGFARFNGQSVGILCGLYADEAQSRRRNDRHPGGPPDPQRRRLPGDHRRMSRLRIGAQRADDRGHQTHASRHGLRLHPGLGRQAHQQGQVLHREARHRTGAGVPAIR